MLTEFRAFLTGARLVAALIGALSLFAAGVTAAEIFEHKAPGRLLAQRDARAEQLADMTRDRDAWKANRALWKDYADRLEAARAQASADAIAGVVGASQARRVAAGDAFNQGYSAGRAAGVLSCSQGVDHAPSPNPAGHADVSGLGGLRNDGVNHAADWNAPASH